MGKKKNIILGLVGLEILALPLAIPATAQIVERVFFSVPPRIAQVELPPEPGKTSFIIASNAPFSILSESAVGDMSVNIQVQGLVNGNSFGQNAQHPGPAEPCVTPITTAPSTVYKATRKTAANKGAVIAQAVLIEIRYDPTLSPKFSLATLDQPQAQTASLAPSCTSANS